MITVEDALKIAQEDITYRKEAGAKLCDHSQVRFQEKAVLDGEKHGGKVDDIFVVWYEIPWGLDVVLVFMDISANTGEIYNRIGPASYLEKP
jgi:hypothetical protein